MRQTQCDEIETSDCAAVLYATLTLVSCCSPFDCLLAQLALWQAHHVADRLRAKFPEITFKGQSEECRGRNAERCVRRFSLASMTLTVSSVLLVSLSALPSQFCP